MKRLAILILTSTLVVLSAPASAGWKTLAVEAGGVFAVRACMKSPGCQSYLIKRAAALGIRSFDSCAASSKCLGILASIAASAGLANIEPLEVEPKRTYPVPQKPKRGCAAICRADANDNIPGNLQSGKSTFALGEATGPNCPSAVKEAKRIATRALGMQPKHLGCKTNGK